MRTVATLTGLAALFFAGNASAAIMLFTGQGAVTSFQAGSLDAPALQVGSAAAVTFTYDTTRCDTVGGSCYGGNAASGPLAYPISNAVVSVGDWSFQLSGSEWDVIRPGSYHIEDSAYLAVSLPAPSGIDIATDFSAPGGSARLVNQYGNGLFSLGVGFDSFTMADPPGPLSPVPEPTAWALMGLGVLTVGAALRMNRGARGLKSCSRLG
jgi:hypothetical protein